MKELDLPGSVLTDHGTMAGFLPFYQEMEKLGLRGLAGIEAYQAPESRLKQNKRVKGEDWDDNYHLILIAKSREGYRNLLRLSTEAYRTGFYYTGRIDWELLERHHEGLICTSACLGGLVAKGISEPIRKGKEIVGRRVAPRSKWDLSAIHRFRQIFGDDFLIEIHTYDTPYQEQMNAALLDLCEEYSIFPVIATDAHYPSPEEWDAQELLVAGNESRRWDMRNPRHPQCLYIMDEAEIHARLSYLDYDDVEAAIESSDWIFEQCKDFTAPKPVSHLPKFHKKRADSDALLVELTTKALDEYTADFDEDAWNQYAAQLERELDAIIEAKLSDYFLIVWDAVTQFLKRGIMVGPGRGSAGGSLISFLLGITTVDPIKYGLYFERFWNPGRAKGLPDIDIDIPKRSRGAAKQYLIDRYGEQRVLGIGNHIRLRPKSVLDIVSKAMGLDYGEIESMKRIVDQTTDAGQLASWDRIWDLVGDELAPYRDRHPEVFDMAEKVTDRLRGYGAHASAVVISDVDLDGELPCMDANDGDGGRQFVTQHEMHGVEAQGFPKFDFLGLKTLDVLMDTGLLARGYEPLTAPLEAKVEVLQDYRNRNYDELPEEYWDIIRRGRTLGIFQIEEGGAARRIAKEMEPRTVSDLGFIVAANRPGPLRSGAVDRYIERRRGDLDLTYPHEILEPVLEETLGEFIYQEQVIAYFRAIGYSLEEADHIRKLLGKKLGAEMQQEFVRYIWRTTGVPVSHACAGCWEILDSADDGCACEAEEDIIRFEPEDKILKALGEPADVMEPETARELWELIVDFSKYGFNKSHAVQYGTIAAQTVYAKNRWPVEFIAASIRNVTGQKKTEKRAACCAEARKLMIKVNAPDVNRSGVFATPSDGEVYLGLSEVKGIGENASQWIVDHRPYESYEHFLEKRAAAFEEWKEGDRSTRSPNQLCTMGHIETLRRVGAFDSISPRDIEQRERIELEEELLGLVVTDIYTPIIEAHAEELEGLDSIADLELGEIVKVPGIITDVRLKTVRADAKRYAGEEMAFLTIEWQGEEIRFAVFPEDWNGCDAYMEHGRRYPAKSAKKTLFRRNKLGIFKLKPGSKGPIYKGGKILV